MAKTAVKEMANKNLPNSTAPRVRARRTSNTALARKRSVFDKVEKKVFLIKKPVMRKKSSLPYLPKMYKCENAEIFLNKISKKIKFDLAHIVFFEMAQYSATLPSSLPKLYTEIDSSYFFPWKFFSTVFWADNFIF